MPYTKEHKAESRERILLSAAALFPRLGFDAVSIDMLMAEAGLTRGAFYAHFGNKAEVYAESIVYASRKSPFVADGARDENDEKWFERTIAMYLSREHMDESPTPCPLAFLVTDINHREESVREAYTRVFKNLNAIIRQRLKQKHCGRNAVMAATAMMVGGVAVAQALDDRRTADKVLTACRDATKTLLNFDMPDGEAG